MSKLLKLAILFAVACSVPALAQKSAEHSPPKVLQIFREEIKPGKAAAHRKTEAAFVQAFAKANSPTHYLALTSMTGETQAWFLVAHDSFVAWEKAEKTIENTPTLAQALDSAGERDGDLLSGLRLMVAVYRPDLSYRPNVDVAKMRYFVVTSTHLRPGHGSEYEESLKLSLAAHEKANLEEHYAVYQVISGVPSGTFITFVPLPSLQAADDYPQTHGATYKQALGTDGEKRYQELTSSAVTKSEMNFFALSPQMSYVSEQFIASDPQFWRAKTATATTPAKKKAIQKAAKKE